MGIVYEAFDPLIERAVAIKTILKASVDKSEMEEAFNRFRREARAAGRLSHPKIVSIYEYGEDDDMAFIVMELIRGRELKEYFDHEERFSIKDGIRIVLQLLDALDYSHTHGVVHRDIKPANIMITADGKIKIADFGIAKIDSTSLTQVGMVVGTPTYMSPEQFIGKGVDQRTDIYSCGVLLYQFLTGERPFTGSVITIMHKAVNQEAVPPSQLNREVSPELDAVVSKAMAKLPENRYQTAAEFMQALKAAGQTLHQTQDVAFAPPLQALIGAEEMFDITDKSIVLPGVGKPVSKRDPGGWQAVPDSNAPADFERYLAEHPVDPLELGVSAVPKTERIGGGRRAKPAETESQEHAETAMKERLARKIAEIKNEAVKNKNLEFERQQKAAAEREQRAEVLAAAQTGRAEKFAAIVSARESEREIERRMELDAKRRLEEEARRKKSLKGARLKHKAALEPVRDAVDAIPPDSPAGTVFDTPSAAVDVPQAAFASPIVATEKAAPKQRGENKWLIVGVLLGLAALVLALLF